MRGVGVFNINTKGVPIFESQFPNQRAAQGHEQRLTGRCAADSHGYLK